MSASKPASANAILWIAAAFNLGAAVAFAFPASIGSMIGLPAAVPPVYAGLVALFVLLFGGSYAWMATRPVIDRPLLGFAAIGKASVFVAALAFLALDQISLPLFLAACGDLVFAAIFASWLRRAPPRS